MPSLSSISFDRSGWILLQESQNKLLFGTDQKDPHDVLSVHYFPLPPDIVAPLTDLKSLRDSYRSGANDAGAGLVSVDVVPVASVPSIRSILKFPQEPSGMTYVGSLSIPFRDLSFVFKIQCFEVGMTGAREAVVMAHLLQSGAAEIDAANNKLKGWARDPYEPVAEYPNMPNVSEQEEYDAEFANHPLSRLRRLLQRIADSTTLDTEVMNLPAF